MQHVSRFTAFLGIPLNRNNVRPVFSDQSIINILRNIVIHWFQDLAQNQGRNLKYREEVTKLSYEIENSRCHPPPP